MRHIHRSISREKGGRKEAGQCGGGLGMKAGDAKRGEAA